MSTVLDSVNMRQNATQTPSRLTPIEWLICTLACIGFAFDTYKVVVMPVVVGPAVAHLDTRNQDLQRLIIGLGSCSMRLRSQEVFSGFSADPPKANVFTRKTLGQTACFSDRPLRACNALADNDPPR